MISSSIIAVAVTVGLILLIVFFSFVIFLIYVIQQSTGTSMFEAIQILRGSYVCFDSDHSESKTSIEYHERAVQSFASISNTKSDYNEDFAWSLISLCSIWSDSPCRNKLELDEYTIYDQPMPQWIQSTKHPVCCVKRLGSTVLVCWNSLRSLGVLMSAILCGSGQTELSLEHTDLPAGASVRTGLWNYYLKFRDNVFERIERGGPVSSIVVCGHSLGGIMSTFFATDYCRSKKSKARIYLYTFGSPRCVSKPLADWLRPKLYSCAHVELDRDIFRMLPTTPCEHIGTQIVYRHDDLSWIENHNAQHYAKILAAATKKSSQV